MRSRYSAFAVKNMDYLLETHDPQTRDQFDRNANAEWAENSRFTELEILRTEEQGNKGLVEFRVTYEDLKNHKTINHHEISKFRKQNNVWFFREGKAKN
jgi:SEC-C motif-containing protein